MTTATKTATVTITSQYGILSRGRHSARRGTGSVEWAAKDRSGNLILTPGKWNLHCTDGFNRAARAVAVVDKAGNCEITGDTSRFTILK